MKEVSWMGLSTEGGKNYTKKINVKGKVASQIGSCRERKKATEKLEKSPAKPGVGLI